MTFLSPAHGLCPLALQHAPGGLCDHGLGWLVASFHKHASSVFLFSRSCASPPPAARPLSQDPRRRPVPGAFLTRWPAPPPGPALLSQAYDVSASADERSSRGVPWTCLWHLRTSCTPRPLPPGRTVYSVDLENEPHTPTLKDSPRGSHVPMRLGALRRLGPHLINILDLSSPLCILFREVLLDVLEFCRKIFVQIKDLWSC